MKKMGLYQVYFEHQYGSMTHKESFASLASIPTTMDELDKLITKWRKEVKKEKGLDVFISNFILVNTLEDNND